MDPMGISKVRLSCSWIVLSLSTSQFTTRCLIGTATWPLIARVPLLRSPLARIPKSPNRRYGRALFTPSLITLSSHRGHPILAWCNKQVKAETRNGRLSPCNHSRSAMELHITVQTAASPRLTYCQPDSFRPRQ